MRSDQPLFWLGCFVAVCDLAGQAVQDRVAVVEAPPAPGYLHVDDGGNGGLPVVFIHSFGGSSEHWAPQLAHLRQTRRAIAIDLRGHGKSGPPPLLEGSTAESRDYSIASLNHDLGEIVDRLGLERFVLVGHGLGGSIAAGHAGAHPERVAGLVLVGMAGKLPSEPMLKMLGELKTDYERVAGDHWEKLLADARPETEARVRMERTRLPREHAIAIISSGLVFDPRPTLRGYAGPKLIVDPARGDHPAALHIQMPELPRRVIVGTSHWLQLDNPSEFNRVLDEFLGRVPAAPAPVVRPAATAIATGPRQATPQPQPVAAEVAMAAAQEAVEASIEKMTDATDASRTAFRPHFEKIRDFTRFRSREEIEQTRALVLRMRTDGRALTDAIVKSSAVLARELAEGQIPKSTIERRVAEYDRRMLGMRNFRATMQVLDEQYFRALLDLFDLAAAEFGKLRPASPQAETVTGVVPQFSFLNARDDLRYRQQMTVVMVVAAQQGAVTEIQRRMPIPSEEDPAPNVNLTKIESGTLTPAPSPGSNSASPPPAAERNAPGVSPPPNTDFGVVPGDYQGRIQNQLRVAGLAAPNDSITLSSPRRGFVRDSQGYHYGLIVRATVIAKGRSGYVVRYFMFSGSQLGDISDAFSQGFAGFVGE